MNNSRILVAALSSLLAACATATPETPQAEVQVYLGSVDSAPLYEHYRGPLELASGFRDALVDELGGNQSLLDAQMHFIVSTPDGVDTSGSIADELVDSVPALVADAAAAFDFARVDPELYDDGDSVGSTQQEIGTTCCFRDCEAWPRCTTVCVEGPCGAQGSGPSGSGGSTNTCRALCYAPGFGPCFDFLDWANPVCRKCKESFCW